MEHRRAPQVASITSAGISHTEDLHVRKTKYVWMMLGRVACLLLAVLPFMPTWARILLLVGTVLLPWGAVQIANAATVGRKDSAGFVEEPTGAPALAASSAGTHRVWSPDEADDAGPADGPVVLDLDADGRVR